MRCLTITGVTGVVCLLAACTVDQPQPDLIGQDIRLTIIHTADIHSRLFPYHYVPNKFDTDYGLYPNYAPFGGIARIATLVHRIRDTTDRSLWLDSGDAWEGAAVFNEFKGEPEIRTLDLAGMEGEVIGNHEFDLGSQQLFSELDQWSNFPHLVANYLFDDSTNPQQRSLKDIVKPYEIYDVQGVRIAVIGMGNQDTLIGSFYGGNSLGFRPIDNLEVLTQWVGFLRPQVDLIIVASHLGLDNDEGLSSSEVEDPNASLAIEGVDLILGGHLHIVTNPPKLLPNGDQAVYCQTHDCSTVLVHSGAFAKYVGRIDLVVHIGKNNNDPEQRSRIVSFAYDNEPVVTYPAGDPNFIPDDPSVAGLLWPYSVKLNQDINLAGVFAYIDADPGISAGDILRNDPSGGDSQLGNMVARSMQEFQGVEAQFAFTNSLGIRDNFSAGALSNEEMFNVFPFENTIVVIYLAGQEVKDTLDFVAAKSATRGCQTQLQTAGLTFDMICRDDPTSTHTCDEPNLGTNTCRCNVIDPNNVGIQCGLVAGETQPQADAECNPTDPALSISAVNDRCNLQTHQCFQTACAANIYIGDACRKDPTTGVINPAGPIVNTSGANGCVPLEISGLYRAAVNNYIAQGGSGFIVLKNNTSQQDTGVSLRNALTVFLNNQSSTCPARAAQGGQQTICNASNAPGGDVSKCIVDTSNPKAPLVFDEYGKIGCLDESVEPHDGRIRPVSQ
ncbi:MAG TPA: bifunctional UDP-sugar hydrolase/5'-nucleotidase [Kofleriaceae bacterium]|nr:bifunctional UDP-sugar hydrolase/5'-nucleotidase [Kofleriaceae bacterium]